MTRDFREGHRVPIDPEQLRIMEADPDLRRRVNVVRSEIPAVTHVDDSARVQTVDERRNPGLYGLLRAFHRKTGCPVLVNTSFNVRGEPIVCTPEDAYRCFRATGMDALVLEDTVIVKDESDREAGAAGREEYLAQLARVVRQPLGRLEVAVVERHRIVVEVDEGRLAARPVHVARGEARELLVERIAPRAAREHQHLHHGSFLLERAHAPGAIGDLRRAHLLDAVHHERAVEDERALGRRAAQHQELQHRRPRVRRADRAGGSIPYGELAALRPALSPGRRHGWRRREAEDARSAWSCRRRGGK